MRIPQEALIKLCSQLMENSEKNTFEWTSAYGNVLVGNRINAYDKLRDEYKLVWDFEYNPEDWTLTKKKELGK